MVVSQEYVHLPGYPTRMMLPFRRLSMKRKILLVFLGISLMFAGLAIYASRQVRATPDERARILAGDDLIPRPIGSVNHSITIRRPPRDVWP